MQPPTDTAAGGVASGSHLLTFHRTFRQVFFTDAKRFEDRYLTPRSAYHLRRSRGNFRSSLNTAPRRVRSKEDARVELVSGVLTLVKPLTYFLSLSTHDLWASFSKDQCTTPFSGSRGRPHPSLFKFTACRFELVLDGGTINVLWGGWLRGEGRSWWRRGCARFP